MSVLSGDIMRALFTKEVLGNDEVDTKTNKVLIAKVAGSVAVKLSEQEQGASIQLVETLAALNKLGYGKDSDIVKSVIGSNTRMRDTVGKISSNLVKHTS